MWRGGARGTDVAPPPQGATVLGRAARESGRAPYTMVGRGCEIRPHRRWGVRGWAVPTHESRRTTQPFCGVQLTPQQIAVPRQRNGELTRTWGYHRSEGNCDSHVIGAQTPPPNLRHLPLAHTRSRFIHLFGIKPSHISLTVFFFAVATTQNELTSCWRLRQDNIGGASQSGRRWQFDAH